MGHRVEIDVRADVKEATRYLNGIQKRAVPIATAKALTFTAERAQKAVTRLIPQVFSNPTPFTRRAIRKETASPNNLHAAVLIKDLSLTQDHYLVVQTDLRTSGRRPKKRHEKRLLGGYWIIGKNAKTNRYGNLTRGTYSKMLADVGGFSQRTGDAANTSRKRKLYFIIGNKPRRIIMKRVNKSTVTPWLVEVSGAPSYGRRLPMNRVTQNMVRTQFRRLFDKAIAREVARETTRLSA